MERLVIDIPENKAVLVKQLLEELGVVIRKDGPSAADSYKQRLTNVSVWSDEELLVIEESKKAFESLNPQQW